VYKRQQFHLAYRGDDFRMTITKSSVTIATSNENRKSRTILVAGRPVKCAPGKLATVKYRQAR